MKNLYECIPLPPLLLTNILPFCLYGATPQIKETETNLLYGESILFDCVIIAHGSYCYTKINSECVLHADSKKNHDSHNISLGKAGFLATIFSCLFSFPFNRIRLWFFCVRHSEAAEQKTLGVERFTYNFNRSSNY